MEAPKPLPRTKIRTKPVSSLTNRNETVRTDEELVPVHSSPLASKRKDVLRISLYDQDKHIYNNHSGENSKYTESIIETQPEPFVTDQSSENDEIISTEKVTSNNSDERLQNQETNDHSDVDSKEDADDELIINEILRFKKKDIEKKMPDKEIYLDSHSSSRRTSVTSDLSKTEISNNNIGPAADKIDEDLLAIHIHRADCLEMDRIIRHPSVIVHIVDVDKGIYLTKSKPNKNVTYNQETSSSILPVMTRPFNFKEHKCIIPQWEETLTFNENTSYIIKSSTIFFFEIVDFIDSSNTDAEYASIGWHRIAWAFLKPIGTNNVRNTDETVRLQLYLSDPKNTSINQSNSNIPYIYNWYRKKRRTPYPSTLYVKVTNISLNKVDSKPQQRSCTPLQPEIGSDSSVKSLALFSNEEESLDSKSSENLSAIYRLSNIEWTRLPGQSCRIPNFKSATLHADPSGSLAVKFSNSGIFLACGTTSDVFIYAIDGVLERRLINHQGLIYTLSWFLDDSLLLSASADCTACIWDLKSSNENPLQILPHPSFVYCSTFIYPERTVVTGCYDGIVRIWWHTHACSKYWQLHQELTGHEEYVSAISSFKNKEFFSGDSNGLIIHWGLDGYGRWYKMNVIKLLEIQGVTINKFTVFPRHKRLLIHTRDSLLRTMDIKSLAIIQWYQGGLNDTSQCNSVITPCGSLVFANSEDGTVNVWESNTAKHLAFYSVGKFAVNCGGSIDYHPLDHMCAFSVYSSGNDSSSINLFKFSQNNARSMDMMYLLDGSTNLQYDQTYQHTLLDKSKSDTESYLNYNLKKGKLKNGDINKSKVKK